MVALIPRPLIAIWRALVTLQKNVEPEVGVLCFHRDGHALITASQIV